MASFKGENNDLQGQVDELQRSGSSLDKKLRLAEEQLTDMNSKVLFRVLSQTVHLMHANIFIASTVQCTIHRVWASQCKHCTHCTSHQY